MNNFIDHIHNCLRSALIGIATAILIVPYALSPLVHAEGGSASCTGLYASTPWAKGGYVKGSHSAFSCSASTNVRWEVIVEVFESSVMQASDSSTITASGISMGQNGTVARASCIDGDWITKVTVKADRRTVVTAKSNGGIGFPILCPLTS